MNATTPLQPPKGPDWYQQSWSVPPKPSLSDWADKNRYLSLESNPTGGKWYTSTVEYAREPMNVITDSHYEKITLMWCSQAGKTEIENNFVGWIMDVDPGPVLMIQETIDNGRSWSKDRFEPMLRDTPCLRGKIATSRGIAAHEQIASNEVLHKSFPGGHITIVGSNSGAGLSMRPIRYIVADEVDAWAPSAGEEGDQLDLSEKRTTWFYNRKVVTISSPRIKATSRIEPRFLAGDQRRLTVPCPHCGFYQLLLWDNFKWENGADGVPILGSAHFTCQQCRRMIEERSRPAMLAACKWVAKYPGRDTASFHLWAAYCPPVPWTTLAREYVEARGNVEKMKVFINTRRAETWEDPSDAPDWETVKRRADMSYTQWTVPDRVGFLVAAGDVQDDRIEYSVWGYGRGEESWLIGHDVIYGNTDLDEPYLAFEQKAFAALPQPAKSRELQPLLAFLDSGHKTQEVYNFTRTRPHIYAIKGSSQQFAQVVGSPSRVDLDFRGQKIKDGVQLWPIGVHRIKKLLYNRLKLARPGPRFIHTPHDIPDWYYEQLTSEKLIVHPSGREEFRKDGPNECLDCAVYGYAAAVLAGLADPRTPWDQLVGPETQQPEPPPPPLSIPQPHVQPPPRRRGVRGTGGVMARLLRG